MSLRKIKPTGLLVAVALMLSALISPLKADGLTIGVKGAGTILLTEAFETNRDGAEKHKGDHTEEALIPSLFVEYNLGEIGNIGDGWVIGLDYIPLKPEIADETRRTRDLTKANNVEGDNPQVTQKAKADLKYKKMNIDSISINGKVTKFEI